MTKFGRTLTKMTLLTACFAAVLMCSLAQGATIVYDEPFDVGTVAGEYAAGAANPIVDQGWTANAGMFNTPDMYVYDYGSGVERLYMKRVGSGNTSRGGVHQQFTTDQQSIVGETVEVWADLFITAGAHTYFAIGDNTFGGDTASWETGLITAFGINRNTDAELGSTAGDAMIISGVDDKTGATTLAYNSTGGSLVGGAALYRFHATVDTVNETVSLEVMSSDGLDTILVDSDSWIADADGLPDLFPFLNSTDLQSVGVVTWLTSGHTTLADNIQIEGTLVPEPSTIILLLSACLVILPRWIRRRR